MARLPPSTVIRRHNDATMRRASRVSIARQALPPSPYSMRQPVDAEQIGFHADAADIGATPKWLPGPGQRLLYCRVDVVSAPADGVARLMTAFQALRMFYCA